MNYILIGFAWLFIMLLITWFIFKVKINSLNKNKPALFGFLVFFVMGIALLVIAAISL